MTSLVVAKCNFQPVTNGARIPPPVALESMYADTSSWVFSDIISERRILVIVAVKVVSRCKLNSYICRQPQLTSYQFGNRFREPCLSFKLLYIGSYTGSSNAPEAVGTLSAEIRYSAKCERMNPQGGWWWWLHAFYPFTWIAFASYMSYLEDWPLV